MTKNQLYWAGGVGLVVLSLVALLFFVVEQSLHAVDNSSHPTSPVLSNTSSSSQSTSRANLTGIKAPTQFLDALLTTAPQQHVSPAPTECMLPYQHIGDAHLSDRQLADRFNAASDGVNYQLSASNDPELLMVAAMHEDDPEAGVALAEQAVAMAPNNALVLWNAVMDCHDPNLCPSLDWLEQLSKVDSDNADVWMSLAVEQMRLGDEASALDSLQQAATSSSHNIYFADTIEMGVRAFE